MNTSIRLIVEYNNRETGEVLVSQVIRSDEIKKPMTIKELGYLHEEQISFIQSIQDIKLRHETLIIEKQKLKLVKSGSQSKAAKELIAVIDGGHLKSKENDVRSFEATSVGLPPSFL